MMQKNDRPLAQGPRVESFSLASSRMPSPAIVSMKQSRPLNFNAQVRLSVHIRGARQPTAIHRGVS